MYSDFRQDLLLSFADVKVDADTLNQIIAKIDMVATRYSFEKMTQAIAVRGHEELEEAAKLYMICKKLDGCADSTLQNYALHIRSFVNYCTCPLEEIDTNMIRKYLLLYKMDRKINDESLDHVRQDLSKWFKWLHNEGKIARNPMSNISKIRFKPNHKPSLDPMELERLRDVCKSDRERCLVEVLYSTGCRISEALNIKIKEIRFDLPLPECTIVGKGKSVNTVYFSPRAVSLIKKYCSSRRHTSEYLFCNDRGGGKMQRANAEKIFRDLRIRAGLEDKRLTPHTMRHTTATQACKIAPIQVVQKMLGHAQINTTMRYTDVDQNDVKMYHARAI